MAELQYIKEPAYKEFMSLNDLMEQNAPFTQLIELYVYKK